MYQQAWGVEPSPGVGRALNAAFALTVLVLGIGLLYLARTLIGWLPAGDVLVTPLSALGSFVLWTTVPWLLLDRASPGGAVLAGALRRPARSLRVASTIYMPPQLESYSGGTGSSGDARTIDGWSAPSHPGAPRPSVRVDRTEAPWARPILRALRIETAEGEPLPSEALSRSGRCRFRPRRSAVTVPTVGERWQRWSLPGSDRGLSPPPPGRRVRPRRGGGRHGATPRSRSPYESGPSDEQDPPRIARYTAAPPRPCERGQRPPGSPGRAVMTPPRKPPRIL